MVGLLQATFEAFDLSQRTERSALMKCLLDNCNSFVCVHGGMYIWLCIILHDFLIFQSILPSKKT